MPFQAPRVGIYLLTRGQFAGQIIEISNVRQQYDCDCQPGECDHYLVEIAMPDGSRTLFDEGDWSIYSGSNGPVLSSPRR